VCASCNVHPFCSEKRGRSPEWYGASGNIIQYTQSFITLPQQPLQLLPLLLKTRIIAPRLLQLHSCFQVCEGCCAASAGWQRAAAGDLLLCAIRLKATLAGGKGCVCTGTTSYHRSHIWGIVRSALCSCDRWVSQFLCRAFILQAFIPTTCIINTQGCAIVAVLPHHLLWMHHANCRHS
jgi:hypothetical protein